MGRYYFDKKTVAEDCRSVSIAFLKKHDYFCGWRSGRITWKNYAGEETTSIGILVSTMNGDNFVRFQYTSTHGTSGKRTDYDYQVDLTTTPCNLGGVRYWFLCPIASGGGSCGRRVGTLYLPPGAGYFGCRHCYDLSYASRNETRLGRFAGLGYSLKLERQYEKLYGGIKRWTYAGRPTRKVRKLHELADRIDHTVAAGLAGN